MKNSRSILGFLLTGIFTISGTLVAYAQEYDDMYFNSRDRQKEEMKKKAERDSIRKAEEALLSKNVNPDYMDRLQDYEETGDDAGYYNEEFAQDALDSDRPINIYNNYYGNGWNNRNFDDIYWSNPALYANTMYDPFFRNRIRFNRWNAGWYDPWAWDPWYSPGWGWGWNTWAPVNRFYGGVTISYGWSWGSRWARPWYGGWGYNYYDPFCYSPWGYNNFYGNRWYGGGWGNRTTIIVNNFDNDRGFRRGRRVSRSSSFGRLASNNNGTSTNNISRRNGRIDKDTPVMTRRTSSYNSDSRSGRIASNTVGTRQTTRSGSDIVRSRGTYESRNMDTYTQRSMDRTLNRSRTQVADQGFRSRSTTQRSNSSSVNRNRSLDDRRTNTSSFRDIRSRSSMGNTNFGRSSRSTSSSNSNRSLTRGINSRSNSSGYNRSSSNRSSNYQRSNTGSSRGYTPNRSTNRSSGYNRGSSSSSSSRSGGYRSSSSRSSSSRSSGMSRSSSSSSRSSGTSSRSSSSRSSSRRGGN